MSRLQSGEMTKVAGYYAPDDGGGGDFVWSSESVLPPNGGTVLQPPGGAAAGRWLRSVCDGTVTPLQFGAHADGRTDDGPAIQAATNACAVLTFAINTVSSAYLINTSVVVPAGHRLIGQQVGSQLAASKTDAGKIVTTTAVHTFITGGSHVVFEKLYIAHRGVRGSAIRNSVGSYVSIIDCGIIGENQNNKETLVYISGSSANFFHNKLRCQRDAWTLEIDRIGE